MTSSTEYTAMIKEGKQKNFLNHQLKVILLKNIDDPRFTPILKQLLVEEMASNKKKASQLYEEKRTKEADKITQRSHLYIDLLNHISK